MANDYKLDEGALETIMNGGNFVDPTVQVLGSKKMLCGSKDNDRYRLVLSDGKFRVNVAMYTVVFNNPVVNALEKYSIIKLKRYVSNVIKNKDNRDTRILLILELELIAHGHNVGRVIGDFDNLTDHNMSSSQSSETSITGDAVALKCRKREPHLPNDAKIITPIPSLNPFHNNWVIQARVVNKTTIRNWCNAKGEGKLFSVDLVDKWGEIRCTAFKELVDKFFDLLEVDRVYCISKCLLQPINRQFCSLKHEFEMTMTNETTVEESIGDNMLIPEVTYNFISIDKIAAMVPETIVDVIAICKNVSEIQNFISKSTGREIKKRELLLVDQSKTGIVLSLWGVNAEAFVSTGNPVISIRGAKICDFMGAKNIVPTQGSYVKVNPSFPEARKLRTWYDSEGSHLEFKNVSSRRGGGAVAPWMSLNTAQSRSLELGDQGFYFQTFGTILLMRAERSVYQSCPTEDCQKKVIDLENGMYRCEKCNREYPNFKYRFLVSMNLSDSTSNQWVAVFTSEAEKVLGKTAQEVGEGLETDRDSVVKWFEEAQFKQFVFKIKARVESYNDEQKLKMIVVSLNPLTHEDYNKHLICKIEELRGISQN